MTSRLRSRSSKQTMEEEFLADSEARVTSRLSSRSGKQTQEEKWRTESE
jgi:hypothetical protein